MPEPTPAGGGYTCQVCGTTYQTENQLIEHGRNQHPDRPVTWGDPRESTVRTGTESKSETQRDLEGTGSKMKAGAEALGSKIKDPDKDLKTEYERKKAEERAK